MASKIRGLIGLPHRADKEAQKHTEEDLAKIVKALSEAPGVHRVRRRNLQPLPEPPPPPVPLLPEEGLGRLRAERSLQAVPRDRSHVEGDKELAKAILMERRLKGENAYIAPDGPVGSDPYFKTDKILSLNFFNFNDFIKKHDKTIVMFFDSLKNESFFPSREFANLKLPAQTMSRRSSYSYPDSPQWSPESDEESLSGLSPFIYPPPSSPGRPSLPNLRTQKPRQDQDHFFPPQKPGQIKQEVPHLPQSIKRPDSHKGDRNFPSRYVISLRQDNFEQYVVPMEKVLIYFYNSHSNRNSRLENAFSQAADTARQPGYGFASVDCAHERGICDHYQISQTPVFKLFSNGFDVSTINRPDNFSGPDILQLITMSPVLKKPRVDEGKDFMQQAHIKKQQAHYG